MKDKIISKAADMFLKLGFKSVTMDDIASEMCISKKTIYKFFSNKETLIRASTFVIHEKVHRVIDEIVAKNYNAIEENFEIRKIFKEMFQSYDNSPLYQLKKHYPEIYNQLIETEIEDCNEMFGQNIQKGIKEGLYRKEVHIPTYIQFYYTLIFSINGNTQFESDTLKLELEALEYHTRALATSKGVKELEKQLLKYNN
ncbi:MULTISPECIES: TetR/AcrR family transcriptional regulator [Flavobacterium]|uniref:Biofilm operon icaADBC HTH-type negative transcriptional regulator IcaR n=2 Tax=Flavobacterium TaxID=237 RepID=A0A437UC04_9FLAO|nr:MULTISPECIES: TetR/AcrR family transcriptional regulator [Flavobacterium]OWP83798.1 TetR family transcriptional regulator [Flavobacterium davisii]QYS89990.1 TetR/AcrR family transcriptional regulator [Flavobacterium davisii]RVU91115.1 TetR/AcrR family transcriptional regulator [Flavobacterium columnare]SPE77198.1 Biofilm operon icaADBC HTH-type negative transcriptional regulator IcaR [Flavobacterium columnare]